MCWMDGASLLEDIISISVDGFLVQNCTNMWMSSSLTLLYTPDHISYLIIYTMFAKMFY